MTKTIDIPSHITVGDLAKRLEIEVTTLIAELMKNGVMATVNDTIDFDTAEIIAGELELEVELTKESAKPAAPAKHRPEREMKAAAERPPVIAVMGHVDHGKTTLLDAIRGAEVVKTEAGGITQHISAYQIEHNGRRVTFLDTPGHEAFASLRQHGADLTDLVVLVVAADDGVKPQTVEALKFAQKAGVKIMVAINKVDKPEANINRVLQELNDAGLVPEQWGGDTVTVEVSALKKEGIDKLIDMAFLITDVEELTADSEGPAEGLVIESHMEQGRGAVVTLLVEHGQIKSGDYIYAGSSYGKVRTLENDRGEKIDQAGPSTPVIITGLREMPDFGVVFGVAANEKAARTQAGQNKAGQGGLNVATTDIELLAQIHKDRSSQEMPVIVKADVRGSVTSVVESLQSLGSDDISLRVISSGVGAITENDITTAATSGAVVYGFNVNMPVNVKRLASREQVQVRLFKIIYELIDDAKTELESRLAPEIKEENVGRLSVKGVFKTTQTEVICGGEVTKGKVTAGLIVRAERDKELLGEAVVTSVQRGQQEVKEVSAPEMCGLQLKTESKLALKEGDRLEFFTRETVKRTL